MKTMKKIKKVVCVVLAGLLIAGCFVGCGPKKEKSKGGEKEIEIWVWNSGYGTKHVEKMKEAFLKKHPEYNIKINASVESYPSSLGLEEVDTNDLYIGIMNMDTKYLEPLDDILEYTVEGESMKIGAKFSEDYLAAEVFADGHYYNLTPGISSESGFIYNKKLFKEAGVNQLPRTSDELAVVSDTLYESGIVPMCYFEGTGYWAYIGEAWFLQYDGWDYYRDNFYRCTDENGNSPSIEVFKAKDGRYKTLKALEKIVTPEYTLTGSNSSDYITMQTQFLNGKAAMMVNGQWLENEMASVGGVDDFAMMKMPVISSITEKLDTVKTETGLRKLISAIDAVVDEEKSIDEFEQGDNYVVDGVEISAHDWEYVKLARYTSGSSAVASSVMIPKYSDAKEGAKEFLKFWYSEEGATILNETFHSISPYTMDKQAVDRTDWSTFEKSVAEISEDILQSGSQFIKSQHSIFAYGGAMSYANHIGTYLQYFSVANPDDRITADDAWEQLIDTVDKEYENDWLANIK